MDDFEKFEKEHEMMGTDADYLEPDEEPVGFFGSRLYLMRLLRDADCLRFRDVLTITFGRIDSSRCKVMGRLRDKYATLWDDIQTCPSVAAREQPKMASNSPNGFRRI